uniref:Uncharacterized protein n=1 Tax=Mesocestoides corti TaxID=53468 RepID=A0A5K3FYP0_MESCO
MSQSNGSEPLSWPSRELWLSGRTQWLR